MTWGHVSAAPEPTITHESTPEKWGLSASGLTGEVPKRRPRQTYAIRVVDGRYEVVRWLDHGGHEVDVVDAFTLDRDGIRKAVGLCAELRQT